MRRKEQPLVRERKRGGVGDERKTVVLIGLVLKRRKEGRMGSADRTGRRRGGVRWRG